MSTNGDANKRAIKKCCSFMISAIKDSLGDFYFLLLRVAADLGAKSVKHQDKQTTLQN